MDYKVGVADSLPKADQEVKDVRVVVEHSPTLYVGPEHGLSCRQEEHFRQVKRWKRVKKGQEELQGGFGIKLFGSRRVLYINLEDSNTGVGQSVWPSMPITGNRGLDIQSYSDGSIYMLPEVTSSPCLHCVYKAW